MIANVHLVLLKYHNTDMETRKRRLADNDISSEKKRKIVKTETECLGDIQLGKEIGRGEFGVTYDIDSNTVLKIVKLLDSNQIIQF